MLTPSDLLPYQLEVYEWAKSRTEAFIWLPFGFGKTIVALTTLTDWSARFGPWRALVVAPLKLVSMTWPQEIAKWSHTRHLFYAECSGALRDRECAVESRPDVLGLNYENLKWFIEEYASTDLLPDVLIFDEISKMKDHASKRFKAFYTQTGQFKRRLGLTATPASESYVGLWAQEASVSSERRLGRNITQFRTMHCSAELVGGNNREFHVTKEGKRAIEEKLAPITLSLRAEDYFDLQEPTVVDVPVGWPEGRAEYDEMERLFVLSLEAGEIVAANAGVKANKLRQLCGGCIYHEGKPLSRDTTKLEALGELVEGLHGEHAIVFYQYEWEQRELLRRLEKSRSLDSEKDLRDWNRGKVPYLVLHPQSAGHGLNLHESGCEVLIWYALPWSLEQYRQANARIVRPAAGAVAPARIYRLLREDSIEEDVAARLAGKIESEAQLLEAIRARRKG